MSDGKQVSGQQFSPRDKFLTRFTEQVMDYDRSGLTGAEGNANTEISPIDRTAARVRVYTAATAAIEALHYPLPSTRDLDLPDVLAGVTLVFNENKGEGLTEFPADQQTVVAIGSSGSVSLDPRAQAQGSIAITVDVVPDIVPTRARDVPTVVHFFYLADTELTLTALRVKLTRLIVTGATVTMTQASPCVVTWVAHGLSNGDEVAFTTTGALLTGVVATAIYFVVNKTADTFQIALTAGGTPINATGTQSGTHTGRAAVKQWPKFRTKTHVLVAKGQQTSLSCNASVQANLSWSGTTASGSRVWGGGSSREVGVNSQVVRLPECINDTITIAPSSQDGMVTVTADGSSAVIAGSAGTIYPQTNIVTQNAEVTASVTPTVLSATSPLTAIPITGLYLLRPEIEPSTFFGYAVATAEVVDFSYFA